MVPTSKGSKVRQARTEAGGGLRWDTTRATCPGGPLTRLSLQVFEYDKVYPPETTQEQVYEDASQIITSCIDGYNVCFMGTAADQDVAVHAALRPAGSGD